MICNQCKSRNPIGGKFCRECGTALPLPENPLALDEAARAEKERLNERVSGLLSAAYTLAEQRRYDQALPLTEEAALLLPNSTAALSLLATLYEYAGEDEKAIKAMERVVALNPESPGDREKLGHLRRSFQEAHSDEPFPHRAASTAAGGPAAATIRPAHRPVVSTPTSDSAFAAMVRRMPWIPYALAAGTVVFALGIGLSVTNADRQRAAPGGAVGVERAGSGATTGELAAQLGVGATPIATQPTPVATPFSPAALGLATYGATGDPFVSNQQTQRNRSRPDNNSQPNYYNPPQRYASVYSNDTPTQSSLPPIIAVPPAANTGANSLGAEQSTNGFGNGGRLAVGPPTGAYSPVQPASEVPAATPTPGTIRISLGKMPTSPASQSGTASGEGAAVAGGSGSALSRARGLQGAKRYADAITAYHDAIAIDGSVAAIAQEHIAQCEAAQGHDADARSAYREALHDYESQLAAGRGVRDAQAGINTCKAALEALGSGA